MSSIDRAISEIAARQHAVFSVSQASELGATRAMLRRRAQNGHLTQVDVEVFRVRGAPLTWNARAMTAVLAAGRDALLSHRAAAALWGIEGFNRGTPEVTVPRGRRYRRPNVRVHESTDLDRCSPRVREGIALTDPSRTLLDVGRFVGDRRLERAVESARRLNLTTWAELIAILAKHARRGRPGIRRLRRVIAANAHREEVTDSDFELLVLALLREHGLPDPVVHHELRGDDGRLLAEIDLAYPALRIAIELDGRVHQTDDVFERDRPRQNRIALEGWIILRFTWATLRDHPEQIVREIAAAIRQAKRRA
jgi:very-short-patch-repair endonuclease